MALNSNSEHATSHVENLNGVVDVIPPTQTQVADGGFTSPHTGVNSVKLAVWSIRRAVTRLSTASIHVTPDSQSSLDPPTDVIGFKK